MLVRKSMALAAAALALAGASLVAGTTPWRRDAAAVPAPQTTPATPTSPAAPAVQSVCASQDVALHGEAHRLLAVCARRAAGAAANDPGLIDLYLLKRSPDGWQPVAQRLAIESGRQGQPGEVAVLQLGPAFYGFELTDTAVSQGYVLGGTRLYVPQGEGFHMALEFTSSVKNSGAHECADSTPAACSDLSRRLRAEPPRKAGAGNAAGAYPLRITSLGSFRGQPVSASHLLPYDPQRSEYRLPAGFEAQVE